MPSSDDSAASAAVLPGEQDSYQFHRLCPADELQDGVGRPFTVNGTHVAVFLDRGAYLATDNRCPHMGYPLSEGSIRDGVLICHWHHWEFDLKTGGCFLAFGDDVTTFPVEKREDGYLYLGIPARERAAARRRLTDRGKRTLEQGLKDRSAFLIAKAVTALRDAGATPQEIIQHGLFYGTQQTSEGWSSGVTILTVAANLWDEVDPRDHNLFLVHGLAQIAQRTSGSSRRPRQPFPRAAVEPDLETLSRWFRRYVYLRSPGPAERILITLHERGYPSAATAQLVFATATDYYLTGDGHALDFASKMFEALDYVGWQGAHEILRPIVVDLVNRTRHEETSRWADSVPLLEEVFSGLDALWEANQKSQADLDIPRFAHELLGDDVASIVAQIEEQLRRGVEPTDLCRAMTYASALRTVRFHLKNEGDWHDVANIYSYSHALYRAFQRAPCEELLRGIFHGAVFLTYLRWLNMPAARVPKGGQRLDPALSTADELLGQLQEYADFQKVFEAEVLVNQYLEEGFDVTRLKQTLAHITLREDAELHMFQVLEVALRHFDESDDAEEKRIHLLAATRYITAQKVMKGILWSTENAERLQRGGLLSERDDDD